MYLNRFKLILLVVFLSGVVLSPLKAQAQNFTGLTGGLVSTQHTRFYKDPTNAFLLAFFPGILIHGFGSFYAQDPLMGTSLLTGEVISLIGVTFGAIIHSNPSNYTGTFLGPSSGTVKNNGANMMLYGGLLFGITWVVDMVHAPIAARSYDERNNLQPIAWISPQGTPMLAMNWKF
jgi:hypothetical protein